MIKENMGAAPGTVVRVEKEYLDVATGKDILRITNLQLEGKKRMSVKDFLLGYQIENGMIFG